MPIEARDLERPQTHTCGLRRDDAGTGQAERERGTSGVTSGVGNFKVVQFRMRIHVRFTCQLRSDLFERQMISKVGLMNSV
jgi:hypothetical protein